MKLFCLSVTISGIQNQKKARFIVKEKIIQKGNGDRKHIPNIEDGKQDLSDGQKSVCQFIECHLQKFHLYEIQQPKENGL